MQERPFRITSVSGQEETLAVAKSHEVSPEERRHAQRALSIMMNVRWKHDYFEAIDPVEARRILDEELYGMERVKQRIIETIIQINRTHTLPAYGLCWWGLRVRENPRSLMRWQES